MHEGSRRAILAAFCANLGIAAAKLVGFVFTASAALLAEAIHSLADTANQGLLFLGGRRSRRVADAAHPFGYGRDRYFWAFVVALVLFSLGGLFAVYEGVSKLRDPHELESPAWALAILAIAIVAETLSFRTALREADARRGGVSWWAYVRRSKSPELPVVLLEDSGALLGLFVALAGVGMARLTGEPRWDAAGSLVIGVLLVVIAVVLAVEMKSLLIGESASRPVVDRMTAAMAGVEGVRGFIHLRTEHLGPEEVLVAAKIECDSGLSVEALARVIDAAEAAARGAVPDLQLVIYLEPDLRRPEAATE